MSYQPFAEILTSAMSNLIQTLTHDFDYRDVHPVGSLVSLAQYPALIKPSFVTVTMIVMMEVMKQQDMPHVMQHLWPSVQAQPTVSGLN